MVFFSVRCLITRQILWAKRRGRNSGRAIVAEKTGGSNLAPTGRGMGESPVPGTGLTRTPPPRGGGARSGGVRIPCPAAGCHRAGWRSVGLAAEERRDIQIVEVA